MKVKPFLTPPQFKLCLVRAVGTCIRYMHGDGCPHERGWWGFREQGHEFWVNRPPLLRGSHRYRLFSLLSIPFKCMHKCRPWSD